MRKLLRRAGRPTRRFWWRAMAPALVVGVCLSWALTAGAAQTTARAVPRATPARAAGGIRTTALAVPLATTARAVYGSDGREHIDYDLVMTNAFTAPVTLQSIQVRGAGRALLTLRGRALAAHTLFGYRPDRDDSGLGDGQDADRCPPAAVLRPHLAQAPDPRDPLPAAVRAPRPGRRSRPRWCAHRRSRPADRAPIQIAPPLRGPGWINGNGCCADPTSEHRTLLLPSNGSYRTPEMFAIDWTREVHGRFFTGDGSKLADYPCYGAPEFIHAVADGVVVSAIDDRPQVPAPHHPRRKPHPAQPGRLLRQQRDRAHRPWRVRHLRAHANRLGPRQGRAAAADRGRDRPARQQRQHRLPPSALRDRRPRRLLVQQPPVCVPVLHRPGDGRPWAEARNRQDHRQAAPGNAGGAADRHGEQPRALNTAPMPLPRSPSPTRARFSSGNGTPLTARFPGVDQRQVSHRTTPGS